jgi:F0F1-type ATP synthase membrane subunit b/b'
MSGGGSPVDLDMTTFIMMGLFLGLMIYLNKTLYQPYLRLRDIRYERIQGAQASAKEMAGRSEATLDDYQSKLSEARLGAATERKRARQSAREAEHAIVNAARREIDIQMEAATQKLDLQLEQAGEKLSAEATQIATLIVEKALVS